MTRNQHALLVGCSFVVVLMIVIVLAALAFDSAIRAIPETTPRHDCHVRRDCHQPLQDPDSLGMIRPQPIDQGRIRP